MKINQKTRNFLRYNLGMLRYKKIITFFDIGCNVLIFSHQAAVDFCVRQILNSLNAQGFALQNAVVYLAGILIVGLIRVAAIMGCAVLDAKRAYYYQNRVRANLLRLLFKKDDVTRIAGQSGAIFEVLDDDVPVSTFPAELLSEVSGHFVYTLIALGMLLSINWQLTLFIFIPLSAAIYGIQKLSERIKERRQANRMAHDAASGFISDTVDAVLAYKTSGTEKALLKNYDQINKNRRSALLKDTLMNAKVGVLLRGAIYTGSAIMMFAAARLMTSGAFGIGDFFLFIANLGTLADCVNRIAELVAESRKAEVSYERILHVAGCENDTFSTDAGITLRPAAQTKKYVEKRKPLQSFEVKKLCFDYGDGNGFEDVSFQVKPGELIAVAGAVGSGKSTLLSVLMGLIPADSGEVLLDHELIHCGGDRNLQNAIAGAPQRSGFFSQDLQSNLCLGFDATQEDMLRALEIAAFDEGFAMPDIGNRGGKLSGGQQQRLAMARMLVREARVNIIDDCISALDEETRLKVIGRLAAYLQKTGNAVIIATNERSVLEIADHILYMEKGRVAAQGRFRQLMADDSAFQRLMTV